MVHGKQCTVVGGVAFVGSGGNAREERSWSWTLQVQNTTNLLVPCGGTGRSARAVSRYGGAGAAAIVARNKDRRIGIVAQPQMVGAIAQVTCSDQPVRTELLFKREVPLLHIGRPEVEREGDVDSALGEECVASAGGEW